MIIVKSNGRYHAVKDGNVIAYIEKNYIGTHGHSVGWLHYFWDDESKSFCHAGAAWRVKNAPKAYDPYLKESFTPIVFRNIKEFEDFYMTVNMNN